MPGVTDSEKGKGVPAPSMDDIADVVARTNRGLLALERQLAFIRELLIYAVFLIGLILFRGTLLHKA